jgi:hypothetical protein
VSSLREELDRLNTQAATGFLNNDESWRRSQLKEMLGEYASPRIHPAVHEVPISVPGVHLEVDEAGCIILAIGTTQGTVVRTVADVAAFVDALWQALGAQHELEHPGAITVQKGEATGRWGWTCSVHGFACRSRYTDPEEARSQGPADCARAVRQAPDLARALPAAIAAASG